MQTDNGREFSGAANSRIDLLEETFIDEVIGEIKKLWKDCRMVRGSPRYSPSNGGVERMNYLIETKLAKWMEVNNSKKWSVGCYMVQWRLNTQGHRPLGDKTPYELTFGQKPRVGITNLKLSEVSAND